MIFLAQYTTYEDGNYVQHQHHPPHHIPPLPYSPPIPPHPQHPLPHLSTVEPKLPEECFIETPCTRSCGSGFKLLLPNPTSSHACYGATLQVHPCELKPCAIHCHWGRWSEWSACTISGRRRKRHAKSDADDDKVEARSVNQIYNHGQPTILPPASVRTLNGNPGGSICTQSRQRAIDVPPKHSGKDCKGEHSEARFCQSYECRGALNTSRILSLNG